MPRWFRRWFGRTSPKDPFIFHYRDGTNTRSADPIAIEASLQESLGKDWLGKLQAFYKPVPLGAFGAHVDEQQSNKEQMRKEILAAVDKAFGVHGYTDFGGLREPAGLTDAMRLGLLDGYIRFCTTLVKISRPFANARQRASPSTDSQPTPSS